MTLTQNQFQILFVWIRLNKIRRVFLLLLFKLKLKTWNHVLFKQLRTVAEITKTITRKILRACAIRWIKWKIYSWLVYSWEQPWACWAKMNARWTEFSLPECFFFSSLYFFVVAVLFIYKNAKPISKYPTNNVHDNEKWYYENVTVKCELCCIRIIIVQSNHTHSHIVYDS